MLTAKQQAGLRERYPETRYSLTIEQAEALRDLTWEPAAALVDSVNGVLTVYGEALVNGQHEKVRVACLAPTGDVLWEAPDGMPDEDEEE